MISKEFREEFEKNAQVGGAIKKPKAPSIGESMNRENEIMVKAPNKKNTVKAVKPGVQAKVY